MSRINNFLLEREEDMLEYELQCYYQEMKEKYSGNEEDFLNFFVELMDDKEEL